MLIPYLGEKSKFASFITPNIPEDISTYVEPFAGMFGVFFSLNFSKFRDVKFKFQFILASKKRYEIYRNSKIY